MKHRIISAFVFSLFISLSGKFVTPSFGQDSEVSSVLLTVGGKPVQRDELIYLLSKSGPVNSSPGISREEFEENLDLFINYQLKVREAEAQGLDQTEEFRRELESFKETLIAPFLIRNSLEEGELRKAYSRMQEIIRASHILFQFPTNASTEDSLIVLKMALKVKGDIENGANINELAVQYSDDPSAQSNRGDLGYFTSLQMVQPFEDAAFNLQTGQVSDPVLTNFGYHIIQVQDRKPNPGQVQVSHILVRFEPKDSLQEANARRKIADIYTEIQKESTVWEDIVLNYSEDLASNQRGGILPWFGVGSMIPDFEMAAFSLSEIGEVSPPIRTQYGYHILRLEDKKPLAPFEELEESIRSKILRDSRSRMIQSQVVAVQKARYGFKEDETSVSRLGQELNGVAKADFNTQLESRSLSQSPLFTLKNKTYLAKDLADYMKDLEVRNIPKEGTFDYWYDRYVAHILSETEVRDISSGNKEYQMLIKEYRDGILLFSLMNKEVWQKGLTDSLGQVEFYRKNITNYQWKERVEAYVVKVLDPGQLNTAKNQLSNGGYSPSVIESFEENFRSKTPLAFQTQSGVLEIEDHPVLSQADLSKNYQELQLDGQTYLILIGQKFTPGPRKFEESRGLVIRDYQDYLENTLTQSLKTKYPVSVNNAVKEEAYLALNR
ncbi:peptidylprolyl isomerase [Algoriphagus confluentis]|uniref:Peptidylprolyl isomerase n=1 Tax=Algoriphagus confluentis TaxID=1697556 RepID=A0ABQ6PJW4_9BACT|nr:peptidylprolyl isomerase [Algoriphagus confluentis]